MEWIVKSLKKGGKALVVIPDGILGRVGGKKLRDYILRECFLDAVVSLPVRTFFANFEHTYILAFTKKNNPEDKQNEPVFTYLVSNIGEKLTSVKREEIDENDLPELETLYRIFSGAKSTSKSILERESGRCKIQDIDIFMDSPHWVIDRWWSRDEKIKLGIVDDVIAIDKQEIDLLLEAFNNALNDYDDFIASHQVTFKRSRDVNLGDTSLFNLFIGKRIVKKDLPNIVGDIPVYSANVIEPFGYINTTNIDNFMYPSVLWGIDGNFDFSLMPAGKVFATTDHCGTIQILSDEIVPEYLLYALNVAKIEESFDRSFRASLFNMKRFTVKIPVLDDGSFDIETQKKMAAFFVQAIQKERKLEKLKANLDALLEQYILSNRLSM